MKTKIWIALIAVLLVICGGLSILTMMPQEASSYAEISSQGKVVRTVNLQIDQQFQIGSGDHKNTITIQDGKIAVTEATCPDHYCTKRGFSNSGTDIVCLPNRLVIHFLGVPEIDAVSG